LRGNFYRISVESLTWTKSSSAAGFGLAGGNKFPLTSQIMLSPAEILHLARLYGAAEGVSLGTVGRRALKNNKIIARISAGHSANASSLIKLESFFRANWPPATAWPAVLGPRPDERGKHHETGDPDPERSATGAG
jgi:hypothetical protein